MPPRVCSGPSQVSLAVHSILPRDLQIGIVGIAADVGPHSAEVFAVDVDERVPRRGRRLAGHVGAVVDAVEIDRLAVVADPCAGRRRREAGHRRGGRPHVHVRHHLVEHLPAGNPARRPHDARDAEGAFEHAALLAAERRHPGIRPGVLPRAVVGGDDDDGVGRLGPDRVHDAADVGVELQHRVRVVAELRLAPERLRRVGRVVHLHEVDIHEEGLGAVRVLLDVGDRRVRLPHVEVGQVVVGDPRDLGGGLAGHALPFIQVHDLLVGLPVLRVVLREPRVKVRRGVVVGVDARIVGGELLHLVEAVLDRVELGLVAEMPLAREVGRVAVLLEELGDRRRLRLQAVLVTGRHDHGQGGADRDAAGDEGRPAGGAARLAVPAREQRALLGELDRGWGSGDRAPCRRPDRRRNRSSPRRPSSA